jgi:hypothetical protein
LCYLEQVRVVVVEYDATHPSCLMTIIPEVWRKSSIVARDDFLCRKGEWWWVAGLLTGVATYGRRKKMIYWLGVDDHWM